MNYYIYTLQETKQIVESIKSEGNSLGSYGLFNRNYPKIIMINEIVFVEFKGHKILFDGTLNGDSILRGEIIK